MTRFLVCAVYCFLLPGIAGATPGDRTAQKRIPVVDGPGVVITSSGTHLAARETAGPDTFALYGGPDHPTEGKFQLANGVTADWGSGNGLPGNYGGGPGAWIPVDLTDEPVFWHRSQFNAQTLGTNQPIPNHAMWCGVEAGDPLGAGWVHTPGYGNSWDVALLYESDPIADTTAGEIVSLDFYFHHDTEPDWDNFIVEYDSAGTWIAVLELDGSNKDASDVFHAPGLRFGNEQTGQINFAGDDYGGDHEDQIRIRIAFDSDGTWSDEDGLWPTTAGAAQVDQITLTTSQGSYSEDYEADLSLPDRYLFHPDKQPFAGDFVDVYPHMTDIDPCRSNQTPVIGMIDYGQIVRNGPGIDGTVSTGGSTSQGVNYGIVGNYVMNYSGGLSLGAAAVYNEIWSPEILWDLPGYEDDAVDIAGAFIRFTVWSHLPLFNGIFYVWAVRSDSAGEPFDWWWADRNFVYYDGGVPVWKNHREDVSNLLQQQPERVQMSLGAIDYAAVFGFGGSASTPSPCFDNAAFYKYRLDGPVISTRTIDLAQDGFPISGSIAVASPAERDALDIPFNIARDVNTGDLVNSPGDSIFTWRAEALIPGTVVEDVRLVWALKTNPLFEDALREAPSSIKDENVVAGPVGSTWRGEVAADTVRSMYIHEDVLFFNLPDEDFIYPGDVLHYYMQLTDNEGRMTTLPRDTSGFLDFSAQTAYDRLWTVRALPSIRDASGTQPEILVINDFGHRGNEDEFTRSFAELGYIEGIDYDTYTVRGPTSGVSNGIGSAGAHGATADQLAGYDHLFYFAGDLRRHLLSNGTNSGNNDKGDDIGVLEQWHALPGTRNCAYFGDYIASALIDDSAEGLAYVGTPMGIAYGDRDVRDVIGGQTAPLVVPNAAVAYSGSFTTSYIAYGGCLTYNEFDQIQPAAGADAGHLFTDAGGTPIPPNADAASGGVASVISPTAYGLDITFPYAMFSVRSPQNRAVDLSARTQLFQEILELFSVGAGGVPVAVPGLQEVELRVAPNPFNPSTVVKFTAVPGSEGSVKVYNLRGELVRALHTGEFRTQEFRWDGTDSRGAAVGSGIYLIQATDGSTTRTHKVALVK